MAKKNQEEAAVPLSAMIDVVFLLLIYFIITQKPIIEDVFLTADLPAPNPAPPSEPPPPPFKIDVIEGQGATAVDQYRIDGRTMSLKEIEARLQATPRETTVIISCDPNGIHKKLVNLLDILQYLKFTKLNLVDDMSVRFRP